MTDLFDGGFSAGHECLTSFFRQQPLGIAGMAPATEIEFVHAEVTVVRELLNNRFVFDALVDGLIDVFDQARWQ